MSHTTYSIPTEQPTDERASADPLAPIATARERVERERHEVEREERAFERFVQRVSEIEPTAAIAPSPAAVTVLRSDDDRTAASTRRVLVAYRETVMDVPHYEEEYGDTLRSSIAAEFDEDVAAGLLGDAEFTPPLKGALIEAARRAIRARESFRETLREEEESLAAAAAALEEVEEDARSVVERERDRTTVTTDTSEVLSRLEERCDEVARDRQAIRQNRLLPDHLEASDVCTYLYREYDWTYPVLSTVASLCGIVGEIRWRIVR